MRAGTHAFWPAKILRGRLPSPGIPPPLGSWPSTPLLLAPPRLPLGTPSKQVLVLPTAEQVASHLLESVGTLTNLFGLAAEVYLCS